MALQTFTAGQVLTAAQVTSLQSNDFNQTVATKVANYTLVAADKGTRVVMNSASATTITVNTSLFSAGDTLFIQNIGAGLTTITPGTATVTTASTLVIPQWGGGTLYFTSTGAAIFFASNVAGMELIKAQTIGTTVASVAVTNVFSARYDNYLIMLSGGVASGATVINMILGATATGYSGSYINGAYTSTTVTNANDNNAARWLYAAYGNTDHLTGKIELSMPFIAKNTYIRSVYASGGGGSSGVYGGFLNNTTSYTDFTLTPNTGGITLTGGTIAVYGLVE